MSTTTVDLARIAEDIWAAMLGLELHVTHELAEPDPQVRLVTGAVQITGDWEGAVTVQGSESFARRAAAAMFMMDVDDVGDEELSDTVGELANMVGGNVKSELGGSAQLSLPAVTIGREYTLSVPGSATRDLVTLDCDGDRIVLTLLQRQAG
jgi:chemotaxis protein CheX